ncbi:MAG: hypothetical protein ABI130_14515 [Leifsonia sp.]
MTGLDADGIETIEDLIAAVEKKCNKPILLNSLDEAEWGALTAFLEETEDEISIYYRIQDTPQYRLQCICHELGHLVMGTECALMVDEAVAAQVEVSDRAIRVHARDLRDTPEERAAEEFAFGSLRHLRDAAKPKSRAAEIFA